MVRLFVHPDYRHSRCQTRTTKTLLQTFLVYPLIPAQLINVYRLRRLSAALAVAQYLKISDYRSDIDVTRLFVGCLTSQQHVSVSQGRICSDNFTCCHTEIEVADQTFYLTQSQYTDTGPTSPSADPITPGAWQGIHWSANF